LRLRPDAEFDDKLSLVGDDDDEDDDDACDLGVTDAHAEEAASEADRRRDTDSPLADVAVPESALNGTRERPYDDPESAPAEEALAPAPLLATTLPGGSGSTIRIQYSGRCHGRARHA
jgi:hypothetical protein